MNTILEQSFSVPFRYPVAFTENLFDPENQILANVLRGDRRPKVLFVIDSGVTDTHPHLIDQVKSYASVHSEVFTLAAEPLIAIGGETCKNEESEYQKIVEATHLYLSLIHI